jgi:hypothetical protein
MDYAKVDALIQQANARLNKIKAPKIERRGNWLWLRGTFPPKPHLESAHLKPYQQRHRLELPADPKFVRNAEQRAQLMGSEIHLRRFNWANYCEEYRGSRLVQDWIAQFEQTYWDNRGRSPSAESTLKIHQGIFARLPQDIPLTLEIMLDTLQHWKPNSRGRQKACNSFAQLARLAGLEDAPIRAIAGNYSPRTVQPKDLPTDEEIVAQYHTVKSTALRWIFGVIATYGLRPHEPFHLDLTDFPVIRVGEHTKTGYRRRFIYPLYSEWAEEWRLWERELPNFEELQKDPADYSNTWLCNRVSNRFRRRKVGFSPLFLRHCFAARMFRFGHSPAYGAKQMGHSVKVHETIYQAWISEKIYQEMWERQNMKSDRPKAPL